MNKRPDGLTPAPHGCTDWPAELKYRIHAAQRRTTLAEASGADSADSSGEDD